MWQSDREAQVQGDSGVFNGKEEKQLLLAQGHPPRQLNKPEQGSSSELEEEWGSAFLSHQVVRSTFFLF